MKNLKKVLALALALVMSLSLFAGATFTDQASIGADYIDDVNMLVQIGVLGGYPDGSFKPQDNVKRSEIAKIIYTIKYGKDDQGALFSGSASQFTDVEGVSSLTWAKGYINYCANQGIVGGKGNNKFDPNGNVTVAETAKMLLVVLGCDATKEGFGGSNWMGNTVAMAMETGVFDGWAGDPTAAATRELIAKLACNTLFAPTYVYNPITGVGSQVSALDPNVENELLCEKTMGMKHVEGLVVANDNFAILVDEDGEALGQNNRYGSIKNGVAKEDEAVIYYKSDDDDDYHLLTIDRDLDDDMIGAMVDVYFTADGKNDQWTNVEVVGDVVLDGKTVIYEVSAGDIEIMPNGESGSQAEIYPYISFTDDEGAEQRVELRTTQSRTKIKRNIKGGYDGAQFAPYFFFADVAAGKISTATLENPTHDGTAWTTYTQFMADLKSDNMQTYRFVSVDGGRSFSYIIRTSTKALTKVTNYRNDTITISNIGTYDLDEVNIIGEVARGDDVVVWAENGLPTIEKAETVTGKATFKGDYAVIGDVEYRGDKNQLKEDNIAEYFQKKNLNNTDSTAYITYNGYILKLDSSVVAGAVEDYAVVVASSYDTSMGSAKVKLVIADETEVVYELGKIDGKDDDVPNAVNNGLVGELYRYSASNGIVNLYTDNGTIAQKKNAVKVSKGQIDLGNAAYTGNSSSIVYLVYGGNYDSTKKTYSPIKALVYKLADLDDVTLGKIAYHKGGYDANGDPVYVDEGAFASYVVSTDDAIPTVIAAAVSSGKTKPQVSYKGETVAFILDVKYQYNFDTKKWYATVKMIGEGGLIDTYTVDEIDQKIGDSGMKVGAAPKDFDYGAIANYTIGSDNIITGLKLSAKIADMKATAITSSAADGFYYANIADIRDDIIGMYPYNATTKVETVDGKLPGATAVLNLEDDYEVIAIDDGEFVEDGEVELISDSMAIAAGQYNAIVHVRSGKVDKIFTLYNNY